MKKRLFAWLVAVLVFGAAIASIPFVNNTCASAQLREMKAVETAPQSVVAGSLCKVGRFVGNGGGTQYFTAILLKSKETEEALRSWYEPYGYKVERQIGQEIAVLERGGLAFESSVYANHEYYIVYLLKDGIPPFSWLDIRGA